MWRITPGEDPSQNNTFIHEIAHQWFNYIIGNDYTEPFLSESFAEFSAAYFFHEQGEKMRGFDYIRGKDFVLDIAINPRKEEVDKSSDKSFSLYYERGPLVIYELYCTVGQEKFDAFMQKYFGSDF